MPISRAKCKAAARKAVRTKARKKTKRRATAKKASRTRKRVLAAKKVVINRGPI